MGPVVSRPGFGYIDVFRTFDPTIWVPNGEQARMANAKRRLAAILSADVAGYSRLMGDDERATMQTLNTYRSRRLSPYAARRSERERVVH